MELLFDLLLPRDRLTVPMVRHLFGASLDRLGVVAECIEELELAITEACSNALKHARAGEKQYEVSARVSGRSAEVTVTNLGFPGEVPEGSAAAPLDAESGRGMLLMSHLVDHLSFRRNEDGTSVKLSKKLTLREDSVLRQLAPLRSAACAP
jgi:serine/threonine-protein kinase RsbW